MKTLLILFGCIAIGFPAALKSHADNIVGPITNPKNGHDYYLLSPDTWTTSEAEAESLGGTLAVVRNAEEQKWIFSTFGAYRGTNRDLWIGLHRVGPERSLQWVTGENFDYQNWAGGQPDDAGRLEGYVDIASADRPWGFKPGGWNDARDDAIIDNSLPCGVVELPGKAHKLSLSKSERALVGNWYEGGSLNRPCWITATDTELFMLSNERTASRLTLRADGKLFVPGYQTERYSMAEFGYVPPPTRRLNSPTGMSGQMIQDKILWSDGTWWSRKPSKEVEGRSSNNISTSD